MMHTARICRYGVPLLIDDRVDVALAVDADGVHVGKDDMPPHIVRRLIGPNKLLGVSTYGDRERILRTFDPEVSSSLQFSPPRFAEANVAGSALPDAEAVCCMSLFWTAIPESIGPRAQLVNRKKAPQTFIQEEISFAKQQEVGSTKMK